MLCFMVVCGGSPTQAAGGFHRSGLRVVCEQDWGRFAFAGRFCGRPHGCLPEFWQEVTFRIDGDGSVVGALGVSAGASGAASPGGSARALRGGSRQARVRPVVGVALLRFPVHVRSGLLHL